MLSWLTLEEGRTETIIPRQAPEVVGRDKGVVVGHREGISRVKTRKNSPRRPAARMIGLKPTTGQKRQCEV